MLIEKTVNIKDTVKTRTDITVSSVTYNNGVVTITAPNHHILPGTDLYLERPCGDGDIFVKSFNVYDVVDENTFRIQYDLDNYRLSPISMQKVSEKISISGDVEDFLLVTFSDNNKHICCKDRSNVNIRYFYDSNYTFGQSETICVNEYEILFNNLTCYHTDSIDAEGRRVFNEPMLNINDHYVWYVDEISGKTAMGCAFIPFSPNGYDNRTLMYLPWDDKYEKFQSKALFCLDCRFFNLDGISGVTDEISGTTEEITLELLEGTSVYTYSASLNLQIGLTDDFNLNLVHEDEVSQYIIERQQANISNIIDFEKRMFEPVYINNDLTNSTVDDSTFKNLKSIRFNVFLRDRTYDEGTGDWTASNDKYWYSLYGQNISNNTSGNIVFRQKLKNNEGKGDLLGSLGFDDDDVINQKERLSKTFIRLSFYDSKDRATQNLLFYSTMFINTSSLYAKYMRNISSNKEMRDDLTTDTPQYVRTTNADDDLALCTNFTAYDKFNMSGSSEGFYIYLFPDIVNGAEVTDIYMKVEFNHAKYGATVPLVCPSFVKKGVQEKPRADYVKAYTNNKEYGSGLLVDLPSLYDDMYIRICVKRDYTNNRYVWFLPNGMSTPELVLNLYEPRINRR